MKSKKSLLSFFTCCFLFFAGMVPAYSQNKTVSGTVTAEAGAGPLEGASITVKGTRRGAVTDVNGHFSLTNVRANATLVISSSGFVTQELPLEGRESLDVTLARDSRELSEVVVTAFGVRRNKRSLAYSTQVVDGNKLTETREVNVVNALKGKVAGVHINASSAGPAGSSFVVIRGASSLTGTNQPLYVVDGVPIDNSSLGTPSLFGGQRDYGDGIGNINPDDIESVSVLKGPAAASLYGARGAHGVILITSKKGKSGKMSIDFNSNSVFETINTIPTFQNTYGGGYNDDYSSFDKTTVDGQQISQWPSWLNDNWGGKYDGQPISIATWPELGVVPYTAKNGNNFKNFFRTGSTFTNTISVSGGSDKAVYRVSASDLENTGILPNNKFNRQSVNLMLSLKATDKLTVEGKVNYIRQHEVNPLETGGLSTSPVVALNRMPLFLDLNWLKNYKREDGSQINYKSGSPQNPYWLMHELQATGDRDRILGYILAKYQFTNWLSLQARSGTDFYYDTRFSRIGVGTPGTTDGSVTNNKYNVKEDNSDLLLTATGDIAKNFTGSFTAGANHRKGSIEQLYVNGAGFNIPNLYNIGNAKLVTSGEITTPRVMNSVYFDAQTGYKNVLFLGITGRNDWSSTLGQNNYSFFYPSVNASFVFSDAFDIKSSFFSFGKLRASYAEAGNDATPFQTKAGYVISSSNYNGAPFATISSAIPLADLKNELTRSTEFGGEFRFFDSRVNLDVTYYNSSTVNQITPVNVSLATGFVTKLINAGEVKNKGIEIFANVNPILTKNFRWDFILNFSRNKSKVVSLAPGIETLTLLDTYNGATIEARPGQAYGNIVGYDFLKNDAGQILLTDQGTYQAGNKLEVLGNVQPDWLGGITNTFSFKGVELSVLVDVRQGGQVFSMSKYNQLAGGTGKFTENRDNLIADGVIKQSDGSYVKSDKVLFASDYYALSGPWSGIAKTMIIDADYVAVREASIGYNLGRASLLKHSVLRSAKISLVARNLFYIYRDPQFKTMGVSPETAFNTTAAAQGVETPGLPTTRSMGINLSFSF